MGSIASCSLIRALSPAGIELEKYGPASGNSIRPEDEGFTTIDHAVRGPTSSCGSMPSSNQQRRVPYRCRFSGILLLAMCCSTRFGHHIHFTIRPQHDEKEDVVDTWAGTLNANFIRKRYWYALPILIPALKVYRIMRRKQWI
jgi:hypothetical protein